MPLRSPTGDGILHVQLSSCPIGERLSVVSAACCPRDLARLEHTQLQRKARASDMGSLARSLWAWVNVVRRTRHLMSGQVKP